MCNLKYTQMELWDQTFKVNGRFRANGSWGSLFISDKEFKKILGRVKLPYFDGLIAVTDRPHVSIIKNETPNRKKNQLNNVEGKKYSIYIDPKIYTNGFHIFCKGESRELCDLRRSFNLPVLFNRETNQFKVKFHITLGTFISPNDCPKTNVDKIGDHISLEDGYLNL